MLVFLGYFDLSSNYKRKRVIEDISFDGDFAGFDVKLKNVKDTHKRDPITHLQMHIDCDILMKSKEEIAQGLRNFTFFNQRTRASFFG